MRRQQVMPKQYGQLKEPTILLAKQRRSNLLYQPPPVTHRIFAQRTNCVARSRYSIWRQVFWDGPTTTIAFKLSN
jgi:hypothetical protein